MRALRPLSEWYSSPAGAPIDPSTSTTRRYLGLAVVAMTTLSVQIALTRLLSTVWWYHLAFFAISTCMLGMTAGAIRVYLRPEPGDEALARDCVRYGLTTLLAAVVLSSVPVATSTQTIYVVPMLLVITLVVTQPFYFAGAVVSQVLADPRWPAGRMYAADLTGAALGCLAVLGATGLMDVPSLLALCAGVAVLAARIFSDGASRPAVAGGVLCLAALVNAALPDPVLRLRYAKGWVVPPASELQVSAWNSFSFVAVEHPRTTDLRLLWGPSPKAPQVEVASAWFSIDGQAGTPMSPYTTPEASDWLRFDVTNVAHFLRPDGASAVIGVGGGRDVQSALVFGHDHVTAVEVNPIIVRAHERLFADYAKVGGNPAVKLVAEDGRSYMARTDERFTVLQMSLVDTWAATGAGAFSLSENGLYTVEAWKTFIGRLTDDGIFTVSRWHDPDNLGETGRAASVAMEALWERGSEDPPAHLAMMTAANVSTLLVCRSPYSPADVARLEAVAEEYGYTLAFSPSQPPEHPVLASLLEAADPADLRRRATDPRTPYDLSPSTDDSPFFFNMLKPGAVVAALALTETGGMNATNGGVIGGNLHAEFTLLVLVVICAVLAVLTSVVPLVASGRTSAVGRPGFATAAILFSTIGFGFMCVEIGLMQRLSAFLGHPVWSLAIVLFSVILSTGIGSFVSDQLEAKTIRWVVAAVPLLVAALPTALSSVIEALATAPMPPRILAAIAFTLPFGLLMGMFFPTGLRLTRAAELTDTAWFWALNGVFGTLASGVCVYVSIHFGIAATLYVGAACYLAAVAALASLVSTTPTR